MNRDYNYKPRQGGGRDGWSYGNTDLPDDPMTARDARILAAFIVLSGLLTAALFYGAWLALDAL